MSRLYDPHRREPNRALGCLVIVVLVLILWAILYTLYTLVTAWGS